MSETLELLRDLVARPSVTPEDAGCQGAMIRRLEAIGFHIEPLPFGEVSNFWARRGDDAPLLVFAGHTDVVPPGPLEKWHSHPFTPTVHEGELYGRGTADMKGGLASMVVACERFVAAHPDHHGSIGFLVTSDEEGPAVNGTVKVVEHLERRGEKIDWCVVGEPSSVERLGDTVKVGRRGSLSGRLTVQGRQGHVAYPHLADNPIHRLAPALQELCARQWDGGNDYFPPTTFQVSNIHGGTGAENVIPAEVVVDFNFRFSTEQTEEGLRRATEEILQRHGLCYRLAWRLSGNPFLTGQGALTEAVVEAVRQVTGLTPELSTSGGTSDGRFIAPTGAQVIELGHLNRTIHQIDERVAVEDVETLTRIYQRLLESLLLP
ncbi:MAG TPA: succinyl-diaminopimelate desuccinylase [Thiotrichales bacterium]|nr:succinyl-diaminopimelate desuccinylase [Thiotrichales bacterium]